MNLKELIKEVERLKEDGKYFLAALNEKELRGIKQAVEAVDSAYVFINNISYMVIDINDTVREYEDFQKLKKLLDIK